MSFFEFPVRNASSLQRYLIEKINHGIKSAEKYFKPDLVAKFINSLGWDFQILNDYVHNISAYKDIDGISNPFSN